MFRSTGLPERSKRPEKPDPDNNSFEINGFLDSLSAYRHRDLVLIGPDPPQNPLVYSKSSHGNSEPREHFIRTLRRRPVTGRPMNFRTPTANWRGDKKKTPWPGGGNRPPKIYNAIRINRSGNVHLHLQRRWNKRYVNSTGRPWRGGGQTGSERT